MAEDNTNEEGSTAVPPPAVDSATDKPPSPAVIITLDDILQNEWLRRRVVRLVEEEADGRDRLGDAECTSLERIARNHALAIKRSRQRSLDAYAALHQLATDEVTADITAMERRMAEERRVVRATLNAAETEAVKEAVASPTPRAATAGRLSGTPHSTAVTTASVEKQRDSVARRLEELEDVHEEAYQREWVRRFGAERALSQEKREREERRREMKTRQVLTRERALARELEKERAILAEHAQREARRRRNQIVHEEALECKKSSAVVAAQRRDQRRVERDAEVALETAAKQATMSARVRLWEEKSRQRQVEDALQTAARHQSELEAAERLHAINAAREEHEDAMRLLRRELELGACEASRHRERCQQQERDRRHRIQQHHVDTMRMHRDVSEAAIGAQSARKFAEAVERETHTRLLVEEEKRQVLRDRHKTSPSVDASPKKGSGTTKISQEMYNRLLGPEASVRRGTAQQYSSKDGRGVDTLKLLRHVSPAQFSQLKAGAKTAPMLLSLEKSLVSDYVRNTGPARVVWRS
eukprot:PhM_4_TR89/c0_g1_i1/m.34351